MVELALIFGIFSYLVFGLGLMGEMAAIKWFGALIILGFFVFWLIFAIKEKFWLKIFDLFNKVKGDKINFLLSGLLLVAMAVNLIGALGPELGFDSLWYHLAIPKIYLSFDKIFYIPGSLYSYSVMPKLAEMLYLFSLQFSSTGILAKLAHLSFGIFSVLALFKLSRKYLDFRRSLIVCLVFYTSLIVGWESITAYVDLARTFFEILALGLFLDWWEEKKKIFLWESAVLLGLAVSTKLIAVASLPIFLLLIFVRSRGLGLCLKYFFVCLLVFSPWLIFSYINTGNPIFPIFSGTLDKNHLFAFPNFLTFVKDFWTLFYHPHDLISPIFLIFLPVVLLFVFKKKITAELKVLGLYVLLSGFFWYLTPRTGGSRFILPYLPIWSLFLVIVVSRVGMSANKLLLYLTILLAVFNIGYRAAANYKFVPVLAGTTSKDEFLLKNLNFIFNDFYDPGSKIKNVVGSDSVLVFGSHNLFYADFSFFHESFAPKSRRYSYVLTQNTNYPQSLGELKKIYQNSKTNVSLYVFGGEYQ